MCLNRCSVLLSTITYWILLVSLFLTMCDGCFLNELENLDKSDFCTDLSLAVSLSWFLFKKVDW